MSLRVLKVSAGKPVAARGSKRSPSRRWGYVLVIAGTAALLAGVGLVVVPMALPQAGGVAADALRTLVGPRPVAELESVSLRVQEAYSVLRFQLSGGKPQLAWAQTAPSTDREALLLPRLGPATATSAPSPTCTPTTVPTSTRNAVHSEPTEAPHTMEAPPLPPTAVPATRVSASATPAPTATRDDAPPRVEGGWQAFGPHLDGHAIMWRATVRPDAAHPHAEVALVRIALEQVRISLVPGRNEPSAAKDTPPFPRPGVIPSDAVASGRLLAAFNGGFQAVHGGYGMMVENLVIRPPLNDVATLGVYCDGAVRIGAWGRGVVTDTCLLSYRQNCPPLIEDGEVNPLVRSGSRRVWGLTITALDTTWRSGLGISADARFLTYAVGHGLTVEALARALRTAGVHHAMQLDINPSYTHFVTYLPAQRGGARYPVVAQKLLAQMVGDQTQYLAPYGHDFVVITAADGSAVVTYTD